MGCTKPPPSPAPPPDSSVYAELVAATRCLQAGEAGALAVEQGLTSDAQPPWFACLVAGGTVASCGGPCVDAGH
jgi:hypothetical protein